MSATAGQSLAVLRLRAAHLAEGDALRALAQDLAEDPRAGGRALGLRCRRRADGLVREEQRLERLLALRARLQGAGARRVAGVDEVGVGPLAGPVMAAAVILPAHPRLPGLDDSKRVPRPRREQLAAAIRSQAVAVGIGAASSREIDRLNIYQAALLAMRRAVEQLAPAPDHLLVDARTIPGVSMPQTPLVGGDGRDASIAAASIVAKVTRDALMTGLDARYPGYGFARHKGYGTQAHLEALQTLGPTPHHRRSFAPLRGA